MMQKKGPGKQISTYYLTEAQIHQMVENAPNLRHRVLIRLLKVTAGRRFEVKSLRIEEIDWDKQFIRLIRGKGGSKDPDASPDARRERVLDIGDPALLKDLKEYIGKRTTGLILQSNRKKDGLDDSTINRMVKKCGILANIKNPDPRKKWINPHLFRHTFGRDKDLDLPTKQAMLGHRDAYITMQMYGGLRSDDAIQRAREIKNKEKEIKNNVFCKSCGKGIFSDSIFCRYCGDKQ